MCGGSRCARQAIRDAFVRWACVNPVRVRRKRPCGRTKRTSVPVLDLRFRLVLLCVAAVLFDRRTIKHAAGDYSTDTRVLARFLMLVRLCCSRCRYGTGCKPHRICTPHAQSVCVRKTSVPRCGQKPLALMQDEHATLLVVEAPDKSGCIRNTRAAVARNGFSNIAVVHLRPRIAAVCALARHIDARR